MSEFWHPLLLAAVGLVAGTLNVVAGGGSFLTLPILIFMGLPAGVANGTNRVGILLQNVAAVWSFDHHGVLDRRALLWAALPASIGAVAGVRLALITSDQAFERILAILMVALSLVALWRPGVSSGAQTRLRPPVLAAGFLVVGLYAGFIQAGVGFVILAVTTFAGLDLVRGNAVKVLTILCLTGLALIIFASQGRVQWIPGLCLGVGTILGALIGARLTVLKGHIWLQRVVSTTIVLFAVKLWLNA